MQPRMMGAVLLVLGCTSGEQVSGQTPGMVAQDIAGHTLYLREGFKIGIYAENLGGVRNIVLGPGGVAYAALQGSGKVVRLVDANGDGTAESVVDVATGLNGPFGIAFRGDTMYVGEETQVKRFAPGSAPQDIVTGLPSSGHSTRTVVFGPDGYMYVAVGSSCNICTETNPRRAAVTRFNADGSGEHRFATGLRNSVGLAWHPATGAVWATNNDRDRLGDDLPPDRVNVVVEGGWYGWPECYLPGTPNPEYADRAARCDRAIGPVVTLPAHSAPLGLAFYDGGQFPDAYRGDLFVALHGSWDRSFPTGYKIVRVPMRDGMPAGAAEDFVAGWQIGRRWWGRPVDLVVGADGALYASDDFGDRVYRVRWEGSPTRGGG